MASSLHKIIVGLDLGTTFSGVSFVLSTEDSIEKIEVLSQWPGTADITSKVPTRIAYARDNKGLGVDTWGFAVTSSMESFSWFKLLLDHNTTLTEFDDPSLRDIGDSGMLRLPIGKSAKDVCQDYLTGLYNHAAETLMRRYSRDIFDITPIECWLTVPAIWSDAAKDATRAAALSARFGSRPSDTIQIITEPEAAALAALKPHLNAQSIDPVHPGETVLVCDCGGGTVDLTTYQIVACEPRLVFKEVCIGMGGKLGSTYIDRNFNKWLTDTFGDAYTKIPLKKRAPGSALMRSFETAKRTFGSGLYGRNENRVIEIEHLNMRTPSTWRYDEDESTLKLTHQDMKGLFDPVINGILQLVTSQANKAGQIGSIVDRIILVGGFGDSPYLMERMNTWCTTQLINKIKLTCPPQSQAAIVKGAALRGLECLKPTSRIARRHYGCGVGAIFVPGIDLEYMSFICKWSGKKFCSCGTNWCIRKGQTVDPNTEAYINLYKAVDVGCKDKDLISKINIYCCDADQAPRYNTDPRVHRLGAIITQFSRAEIISLPTRKVPGKGRVMALDYEIKIKFSASEGLLVFSTHIGGREAGRTKIEFHND